MACTHPLKEPRAAEVAAAEKEEEEKEEEEEESGKENVSPRELHHIPGRV